jgi:hypothetical protein
MLGMRNDVLSRADGFDKLQNGNDLVFGESGFMHGDLLRDIVSMSKISKSDWAGLQGCLHHLRHGRSDEHCVLCQRLRQYRRVHPPRSSPKEILGVSG